MIDPRKGITMKATIPVLGALLVAAGTASGQSYYQTAVSKVPILPAPDMCNSGFITTWPDGSFFYPCYNVYPPFEPFNGILPDKNGKFHDGMGGKPYGYFHYPCSAGGPGPGYGQGPGPGFGPGPMPPGAGPGGPGPGFPGPMPRPGYGMGPVPPLPGFPGGFNPERHMPMPGYSMGPPPPPGFGAPPGFNPDLPGFGLWPGYGPPPPGFTPGLPPPNTPPGLPTPGYAPGLPAPGFAMNLPAPGYPGYTLSPVPLPTPGYEPPPGAPKPPCFAVHPFARSPRDFFMWSDVLEDRLVRAQRPSLVP